jgi:hypothetical protein
MPGVSGVTVVTCLRAFYSLHARLRAHRAPGIPCALCFQKAERCWQNSRETRGEIAKLCRAADFTSSRKRGEVAKAIVAV